MSSSSSPEGLVLVIEDTGVGMNPEQINNIMADHFIISSANVDKRKGNGLGYLIIKDLLKIIRGSLSIQSEKGQGGPGHDPAAGPGGVNKKGRLFRPALCNQFIGFMAGQPLRTVDCSRYILVG